MVVRRASIGPAPAPLHASAAGDDMEEQRRLPLKRLVFVSLWCAGVDLGAPSPAAPLWSSPDCTSTVPSRRYITSGVTLFGNKHILNTLHTRPTTLGTFQMVSTAVLGCAKVYVSEWRGKAAGGGSGSPRQVNGGSAAAAGGDKPRLRSFLRDMITVGILRFTTVVAGLLSLKFVAVSFTETIKSSAPFFTVIFSWLMLREPTSLPVALSLIPVVGGLALCSATELSFNLIGFWAAVFNNCVDCVQNVFSKKLLTTQYTYVQLQFYTSAAALLVQLPFTVLPAMPGISPQSPAESEAASGQAWTWHLVGHLVLNGVSFHLQSVMAYAVMSVVSPVTQSVLNTLKRALLIWLSVLWFGNAVTMWSALGTLICVAGVLCYNYARQVCAPFSVDPRPHTTLISGSARRTLPPTRAPCRRLPCTRVRNRCPRLSGRGGACESSLSGAFCFSSTACTYPHIHGPYVLGNLRKGVVFQGRLVPGRPTDDSVHVMRAHTNWVPADAIVEGHSGSRGRYPPLDGVNIDRALERQLPTRDA